MITISLLGDFRSLTVAASLKAGAEAYRVYWHIDFRSLTVAASLKVLDTNLSAKQIREFPQPNGCGLIEGA